MNSKDVPYIVFESEMARLERTIKRLVLIVVLSVALLFASNLAWLTFFNQLDIEGESTETTQKIDGNGSANYIGASGNINNGKSESQGE